MSKKDSDFFQEQLYYRNKALKEGTEIPWLYKTQREQQVDAIYMFFTNRAFRITFYIIVIIVLLIYNYVFLNTKSTKELLNITNKYISTYGTSTNPYELNREIDDDNLSTIDIYGNTLGEARTRMKEVIARDKKSRTIPNIIIIALIVAIIMEIKHGKNNLKNNMNSK